MSASTQKDRIREVLRSAPRDGVCSLFLYDILRNSRNRVYELRDKDGLLIETNPCALKTFHYGETNVPPHVRYRWLWSGDPKQMKLALR